MVGRLRQRLHQAHGLMRIRRGFNDDRFQQVRVDVVRAGERRQDPAGRQHLQCAQIDFLVAPQRVVDVLLRPRERRRIENDDIVLPLLFVVSLQDIEHIRAVELELPFDAVQLGVVVRAHICRFELNGFNVRRPAFGREQAEPAVIAEAIQHLFPGTVPGDDGVVLGLVKKPGLLIVEQIALELHAADVDDGVAFILAVDHAFRLFKSFQTAARHVAAFDDGLRLEQVPQNLDERPFAFIDPQRQRLKHQIVAELIDNQTRQLIGF